MMSRTYWETLEQYVDVGQYMSSYQGPYTSSNLNLTTFTCERPNFPIPWDLRIKKIIFNGPATVVMWSDGTKTVVKCANGELFDTEKAVAMAIWKKFLPKQYCRKVEKMINEAAGKELKRMRSDALKSCSTRKKK